MKCGILGIDLGLIRVGFWWDCGRDSICVVKLSMGLCFQSEAVIVDMWRFLFD